MTSEATAPGVVTRRWRARRPPPTAVTVDPRRGMWATAPIALSPLTVAATYVWFAGLLPARMPVAWDARGTVAESARTWHVAGACVLVGVVLVLLGVAVANGAGRLGFHSQRLVLVLSAAFGGLVSGVWWSLMSVVLAAGARVDPGSLPEPRAALSWVVLWLLLLGAVTAVLCGRPAETATTLLPDPRLPRVELPDEPRRWHVHFCTGFFTLGGCLLALFGSTVFWFSPVVAIIAWAGAAGSLLMGRMTLRIDARGITLAPWGLPAPVTVPLDQVVEAQPGQVHPLSWGGASHRVINARTGLWPRTGPGVTLVLADGRRLGLALDAAEVAAGLINSHLDRARGGPYTGPLRRREDGLPDA